MTVNRYRRLPVGIQSFKIIREENYLYVDKSDIVWNMVNLGDKYNYLSAHVDSASLYLSIRWSRTLKEEKTCLKD